MIYFIQTADNQFTKIGVAEDPIKRLAGLQTGTPYTLKLFGVAMGGYEEERTWHQQFQHLHVRGEWFRTTIELTKFAAEHFDALQMSCLCGGHAERFFETAFYERRLLDLYAETAAIQDDLTRASFCANAAWYGYQGWAGIKPRLERLVGWHAESCRSEVRSMQAYQSTYQTIYSNLPGCRNCICA